MDKARIEDVSAGCDALLERIEHAKGATYAESLEDLECRHDALVNEVCNLVGLLKIALQVSAPPRKDIAE